MQNRVLIRKRAGRIRKIRKIHRATGIYFLVFILIITITGLLLAWKKNAGHILAIPTYQGSTTELSDWLPLDELKNAALDHYYIRFDNPKEAVIDRMDIRPSKGSLKVIFNRNYFEIQLDGANGEILHSGYRISDVIEDIHDGSIIDTFFDDGKQWGKLIYSTIIVVITLLYSSSGFLLWYERRRIRQMKN